MGIDGNMMTVTLVFSPDKEFVLMCLHEKQQMMNFIGGHVKELENNRVASYRELQEETGIKPEDINLKFVREEHTTSMAFGDGSSSSVFGLYVMAGVLDRDIELIEEKNYLTWISIYDIDTFIMRSMGFGNCYTYLMEAIQVLGIEYDKNKIVRS